MAVYHRLFKLYSPGTAAKNTLSSLLIRSLSSSPSGPSLDPEIDLQEAAAQLEKSSSPSPSPSKGRNFHWVFLGCPGVGKGTYAPAAKNTLSSLLIRSLSSSPSGPSLDPEIDLQEAAAQLEKSSSPSPSPSKGRNFHWVFLGCPGVGKGTYASRLSTLLGVPHIATGDLVREELSSSGLLSSQLKELVNNGKLVPDEFIISLLSKRLEAGKEQGESGYILDGFPRTVTQAEILDGVTNIDLVINLKLREEALLAKCLGRRICSECGANYNVACIDIKGDDASSRMYMPPLLPPPNCESKLISRADDTEEVVKERLRIYDKMTQPVEEFYKKRGKLLEFELPGGIPQSWPKLLRALHLEDLYDKQSATA